VNFLECTVGFGGKAEVAWLCVDDDKDGGGTVATDEVVDKHVVLVQLGTRVVPADYLLTSCKQGHRSHTYQRLQQR
jgi:hypothetical protein